MASSASSPSPSCPRVSCCNPSFLSEPSLGLYLSHTSQPYDTAEGRLLYTWYDNVRYPLDCVTPLCVLCIVPCPPQSILCLPSLDTRRNKCGPSGKTKPPPPPPPPLSFCASCRFGPESTISKGVSSRPPSSAICYSCRPSCTSSGVLGEQNASQVSVSFSWAEDNTIFTPPSPPFSGADSDRSRASVMYCRRGWRWKCMIEGWWSRPAMPYF